MTNSKNLYGKLFQNIVGSDNFIEKVSRIEELVSQYRTEASPNIAGSFNGYLPLVGVDLDRTMIFSDQSLDLSDNSPVTPLRVAEINNHKPFGYITSTAYSMLEIVNSRAHLVPVTTRTMEQYRRIRLPGMTNRNNAAETAKQYAVTTNGGKLLVNGMEDMEWSTYLQEVLSNNGASIVEVNAYLKSYDSKSWLIKRRSADNLFSYLILDRAEAPQEALSAITRQMTEWNWNVSMQGRKFYCVPNILTKGFTLSEVQKRVKSEIVITAGDSLLDVPMLEMADIAFRPSHGELQDTGYKAENLTLTNNKGILAGEEIVARILAHII